MEILLNGACGKMGCMMRKAIADTSEDFLISGMVDAQSTDNDVFTSITQFTGNADCIIDFSNHSATQALCAFAVSRNIPLVIATTGQSRAEIDMIHAAANKIPIFLSANMSLGIAILCSLVAQTVELFGDADIEIVEKHHNQKTDVPSGTALVLFDAVKSVRPNVIKTVGRRECGKRNRNEVAIHSLRMGSTVGEHEVIISTATQTLTLQHSAQSRELFAQGALSAAAFIVGKPAGIYNMSDIVRRAGEVRL